MLHTLLASLALFTAQPIAQEGAPLPAATAEASTEALSSLAAARLEGTPIPGAIVAIARRGEPILVGAAGVRRAKGDEPMLPGDLVHIGSCTKAMTAVLLARYVDRGLLRWDSTLQEVLPELAEEVHEGFRGVTVLDLLTHTSGVAADCENWGAFAKLPVAKRRLALAKTNLQAAPVGEIGKSYEYSNLGYMLAGCVAERVGKGTWESLVRKEVFGTLGMESAGFGPPNTKDEVDQPWGHVIVRSKVALYRQGDNPEALGPAGRVHLTVEDWSRFALALTDAAAAADKGDDPFLTPASREVLVQARTNGYACGWGVRKGGAELRHSGSNTYWFATVHLEAEAGACYFGIVNAGGDDAARVVRRLMSDVERLDRKARR